MSEDEQFVREHWERAEDCPKEVNGSPKSVSISMGGRMFTRACIPQDDSARSFREAWAAAAEFTRNRLEEIRLQQIDCEVLQHFAEDQDGSYQGKAFERVLEREQARLTELRRGMKSSIS